MNWLNILSGLFALVGLPTIIIALINIGKILKTVEVIENDLKQNIRPDLKDVREKFFNLEGRFSNAFANASPIALLPKGQEILLSSGLKTYIDAHKHELIQQCCKDHKNLTQYDIQELAFTFFEQLNFGEFEVALKEVSFTNGMSIETIKRIGAIYFRDILLQKYSFSPEDLDKPRV